MSKVPEALSLLWVGMPHPKLHPFTAVRTWPTLCLPILQLTNIPKQVFNYTVDYTSQLLRLFYVECVKVLFICVSKNWHCCVQACEQEEC